MNIIDIILLAAMAISIVYGFYHGFIQSAASLVGVGISILAGLFFGPKLAVLLSGNESITGILANYSDAVVRVGDYELASAPITGVSGSVLDTVVSSVSLPAPIENALRNNILTRAFSDRGLATVNDYVSNTLIQAAIGILCFLACCVAAYLIWMLITSLIRHVFEFPILRQLDWLAGGLFGFARGVLVCYLLVLLLPLVQVIIPDNRFTEYLQTSSIAAFFQNDGFFMRIIRGG
jgi:uncharacterized membrane protein required for colicin V production